MHIDAVQQLAMTLWSSPKLMACVLGSGISRAAGVPTGWEVLLDLIQRQAALSGVDAGSEFDAAKWLAAKEEWLAEAFVGILKPPETIVDELRAFAKKEQRRDYC